MIRYVLFAFLAVIGAVLLLVAIAVVRTLLKPKKTSDYVPVPQPEREAIYARKLAEMVRFETVSRRDDPRLERFLAFHKLLEELFPLLHKTLEKTEIDGNLLFRWKGESSERPIVLMGHQDVVPAEGEWKHPPFSGDIADGKVWGRGSADTKCSVMAFMQAIEELIAEGYRPKQDVYLSSSCTEEVGGDGCPKIVAELKRRGVKPYLVCDEGGAILTEPIAGVKGRYALIGVLEKGQGNLIFTARSNGGHSSYPPKNSPIARLAKLVCHVEKHDPMKVRFGKEAAAMFENLSQYGPFAYRLLFGNLWLFSPLLKVLLPKISPQAGALLKTTVAFTMQSGSDACNNLPQEAKLCANLRFIPHQGKDESIAVMKKIADRYGLETEVLDARDACEPIDFHGEGYRTVERTVAEVFPGLPTSPYVMTGGTDARFYQEICDACIRFSPIFFGPEQMKGMHGLNENLETVCLPGAVDFYKTLVRNNDNAI